MALLLAAGATWAQASADDLIQVESFRNESPRAIWSLGDGNWSDAAWTMENSPNAVTGGADQIIGTNVTYGTGTSTTANYLTTNTLAIFSGTGGTVDLGGGTYSARALIFEADYMLKNGTITRTNYDSILAADEGVTVTLSNITQNKSGFLIGGGNVFNKGTFVFTGTNAFASNLYIQLSGTNNTGTVIFDSGTASGDAQVQYNGGTLKFSENVTASTLGSLSGNNSSVVLSLDNSAGEAVALTVGTSTNGTSTTYSGSITGSGTLTKNGSGGLTLAGSVANTYTGLTTINSGTLTLSKTGGAIAIAGDILINGGTLATNATGVNNIASTSNITISGTGAWTGRAELTVNDVIVTQLNNSGAGRFNPGSGSNLTVNSFTLTGVNTETTTLAANNYYSIAANSPAAKMTIGTGGWKMNSATFSIGQGNTSHEAKIVLQGNFTGTGNNVIAASTGSTRQTYSVLNLDTGTRTFDITGTTRIDSDVKNGTLNKTGSGMLTLAADGNIIDVTVTAGNFRVNGGVTGDIAVNGGTLSGIGTVTGDITVGTGATLAPGNSPGTLYVDGNVTLADGATLLIAVDDTGSSQLSVTGDLTFEAGAKLYFDIAEDSLGLLAAVSIFADGTESITGLDASTIVTASNGYVLTYDSGNTFKVTAIPEPSTYALGAAGLLAGLIFIRRKRK